MKGSDGTNDRHRDSVSTAFTSSPTEVQILDLTSEFVLPLLVFLQFVTYNQFVIKNHIILHICVLLFRVVS